MNNSLRFPTGLLITVALVLSACASIVSPSPTLTQAEKNLQTLRADPTIARWAPNELAQAEQAVENARWAYGGPLHVQHLAFMAEKQVEIAQAAANANREESGYKALLAKRNAMGGGNDSITTLAQNTIGNDTGRAIPINQETGTRTTVANGILLTIQASDFDRGNRLTPAAHNAVHGLLASLARQPWRQLVISGASDAQLTAVRRALAENGVPGWRLHTQRTADHAITIAFLNTASTPATRH